jgi:hypothetical protein
VSRRGTPPIKKKLLKALSNASAAHASITRRKPATKASPTERRIAEAVVASTPAGTVIAASRGRWSSIPRCTAGGKSNAEIRLSNARLNAAFITTPNTARASNAPAREMALLMPDARPASSRPTEFITVVVSGATVTAIPNPRTLTAGRNVAQYEPPTAGRANAANPAAAISGPATSGGLGPNRSTSLPAQRDSTNMIRMNGSSAAPAAAAPYPCTWMRFSGKKYSPPPSAAYSNSVSRFAPAKLRMRSNESGSMGDRLRASTMTNSTSASTPTSAAPRTAGAVQPSAGASMNAKTTPASPTVASAAPQRSSPGWCASETRCSGTFARQIASRMAPSGRLTRKAQVHE